VRRNREIASLQNHIADLTLAKILKHAILAGPIVIAVCKTLFACNDNHKRVLKRRDDSSLPLRHVTKRRILAQVTHR
jgi:hypothetical protein